MSKYKQKQKEVEAQQFLSTSNPNTWPEGVQENALSATGYSYGTLSEIPADENPGETTKDGFEIIDTDYIVENGGGVYRMSEQQFLEEYEI